MLVFVGCNYEWLPFTGYRDAFREVEGSEPRVHFQFADVRITNNVIMQKVKEDISRCDAADVLPIRAGHHIVDIGCGVGGPARYFAKRFGCRVGGVDITAPFVDAANKLTALLKMESLVEVQLGDGQQLPFADGVFDGGYAQHVTMNIADRTRFFSEAYRVLRPGAFFALTEHGLGSNGKPYYPVPWSEDGSGSHLVTPSDTVRYLNEAGFVDVKVEDTGAKYLAGYQRAMELAAHGALPAFGIQILMGQTAPAKTQNAARNIEEGRTHPVQVICQKPH
jgi:ubiquinone/menaquinone biosynthesis C-methylase UbiE